MIDLSVLFYCIQLQTMMPFYGYFLSFAPPHRCVPHRLRLSSCERRVQTNVLLYDVHSLAPTHPLILTVAHPLGTNLSLSQPSAAIKIKDGGHNFR